MLSKITIQIKNNFFKQNAMNFTKKKIIETVKKVAIDKNKNFQTTYFDPKIYQFDKTLASKY